MRLDKKVAIVTGGAQDAPFITGQSLVVDGGSVFL